MARKPRSKIIIAPDATAEVAAEHCDRARETLSPEALLVLREIARALGRMAARDQISAGEVGVASSDTTPTSDQPPRRSER